MGEFDECFEILRNKKDELETTIEILRSEVLQLKQLIKKEKEHKSILEKDLKTLKSNHLSQLSKLERNKIKPLSQKIRQLSDKNAEIIASINSLNSEATQKKAILLDQAKN